MSGTILVAYDFGDIGGRALAWARAHSQAHRIPITVLHAVVLVPPPVAPDGVMIPATPTAEDMKEVQQRLREVAARAQVDATCEAVVTTNVGDTIVQRAADLGASIIVTGTHGRGPVARAFLGSVADYVLRHATCPVVTVR